MKLCEYCGAEMADDANFCARCGRSVRTGETGRHSSGWTLLGGAVVGAIAALIIGYVLSFVALKVGLSLSGRSILDVQGLIVINQLVPRLAGLLYTASHHVALDGYARGGVFLSILLPLSVWTIFPIIAITAGGWISALIGKPVNRRDVIAASIASAVIYVLFLIYLRPLFAVNTAALNLIQIGPSRPNLPAVVLAASSSRLFFDGGLASFVFFVIGGLWSLSHLDRSSITRFLTGRGFLPAWASGGLLAFLIGQVILLALLLLGVIFQVVKGASSGAVALLLAGPAVAGLGYFYLHGITLTAYNSTKFTQAVYSHVYSASIFKGIRDIIKAPFGPARVVKTKPANPVFWVGMLIPAVSVILGAYLNYRNRDRNENPLIFSLKMSAVYTFVLLVASSFYSFSMNAADIAPGTPGLSRIAVLVTPTTLGTVVSGLIFGFVFSLAGCLLAGRHPVDDAEGSQEVAE